MHCHQRLSDKSADTVVAGGITSEVTLGTRRDDQLVPTFNHQRFSTVHFALPQGEDPLDTFFDPTGWGKGVVLVNGVNLGRYWPSIGASGDASWFHRIRPTVRFVDTPNVDGPIPDGATGRSHG
ncbi:hypothetical protein MRX96_059539 [Rhipicephalus microplus]